MLLDITIVYPHRSVCLHWTRPRWNGPRTCFQSFRPTSFHFKSAQFWYSWRSHDTYVDHLQMEIYLDDLCNSFLHRPQRFDRSQSCLSNLAKWNMSVCVVSNKSIDSKSDMPPQLMEYVCNIPWCFILLFQQIPTTYIWNVSDLFVIFCLASLDILEITKLLTFGRHMMPSSRDSHMYRLRGFYVSPSEAQIVNWVIFRNPNKYRTSI